MNLNQEAIMLFLKEQDGASMNEIRDFFEVKLLHLYPVIQQLVEKKKIKRRRNRYVISAREGV
jgi:predicted transcriptional regulator